MHLTESLRYEKLRWQELEKELDKDFIRSIGDIFLSSAFITYLAVFSSYQRKVSHHKYIIVVIFLYLRNSQYMSILSVIYNN